MEGDLSSVWSAKWQSWQPHQAPPDLDDYLTEQSLAALDEKYSILLQDQVFRWRTPYPMLVDEYLRLVPDLARDGERVLELVAAEFRLRSTGGETISIDEYTVKFSHLGEPLRSKLHQIASNIDTTNITDDENFGTLRTELPDQGNAATSNVLNQPVDHQFATNFISADQGSPFVKLGRYRQVRLLGEGSFGFVWLGMDEELQRQVAIKVPKPDRFLRAEDAELYLTEARVVAGLDHPNIVPVYDVGRYENGSIYVVSKYIEGCTLAQRLSQAKPSYEETVNVLVKVAAALHHAHERRLIHRDVKPDNILIEERTNSIYVADFGLAIREEDYLRDSRVAGTPAYMSPEQARGEGHRLDGRSDIFSLGVIMYEMLTSHRPFRGSTTTDILHQVIGLEPLAPREMYDSIPGELDRICLKALSKRAADRYASGMELVDDLTNWRQEPAISYRERIVVPKGLRSFDAEDSEFFLDLLSGPRDRDGLPESIRFWKKRIEETDPERTFSVGLIYGPSGCGKSSLVKAGLLPRLSKDVTAIYIEATQEDTESRILRALGKSVPDLPAVLALSDAFAWLRRRSGSKVVVILDQFEQWLHAHRSEQQPDLVAALRQCDGGQLQAIAMVRDDFAMAAARFMDAVEVPIIQGKNFATVDLFEVEHAEQVLMKFGRAFGKIPATAASLTNDQRAFVEAVAAGLANDGKVVSVRLSLFAEMVKGKPWTLQTLKEVGGTEGIGVNFLDDTFSSRNANPNHQLHEHAARAVLRSLLPSVVSDIKGHTRSHSELLADSGYASRPADFQNVLRVLDSELRLITPSDAEGQTGSVNNSSQENCRYQLTHDYMVPSLREWLTRKQQETRAGRAELKLAERAKAWTARSENRYLPSLAEYAAICTLTARVNWTPTQSAMMLRASQYHWRRAGLVLASLLSFLVIGFSVRRQVLIRQESIRIEGLIGQLMSAEPAQLNKILHEFNAEHEVASRYLSPLISSEAKTSDEKRTQLHARLASVAHDRSLIEPLFEAMLTEKATYIGPISEQLRPFAGELTERLHVVMRDGKADLRRRFHAAVALANYLPASNSGSWSEQDLQLLASQLVSYDPELQPALRDLLKPLYKKLLPQLEQIFSDANSSDGQRLSAANSFADYTPNDLSRLTRLLTWASPEQFAVLYPLIASTATPSTKQTLSSIVSTLPDCELGSVECVRYGQQRANAAITLLRLGGREEVFSVFEPTNDLEASSQFIFRCRDRGVSAEELLNCLDLLSDGQDDQFPKNSKYALLLSLGEYRLDEIPEEKRDRLLKQIASLHANDPSSGVHAAAGWLLRHWGQHEIAKKVDETAVPYAENREWFTIAITALPSASLTPTSDDERLEEDGATENTQPRFAASSPKTFFYTFIVYPAGQYEVGSQEREPDRVRNETPHLVTLTHSFALLDREISLEELIAFKASYSRFLSINNQTEQDAGTGVHWYDAVSFCRWLSTQLGLAESDQSYVDPKTLDRNDYPRESAFTRDWAPRDWPLDLRRRGFRLPTDTEWEVACRGGTRSRYSFGSDLSFLDQFGWYSANSGKTLHSPRELRPNHRGVFDMHGNVSEWSHDCYSLWESTAVENPVVNAGGVYRVRRGGSWTDDETACRSARRDYDIPIKKSPAIGFRLALSSAYFELQKADQTGEAKQTNLGTE